eukprot:6693840-Ditylum_brightwellii.AAC.1
MASSAHKECTPMRSGSMPASCSLRDLTAAQRCVSLPPCWRMWLILCASALIGQWSALMLVRCM